MPLHGQEMGTRKLLAPQASESYELYCLRNIHITLLKVPLRNCHYKDTYYLKGLVCFRTKILK